MASRRYSTTVQCGVTTPQPEKQSSMSTSSAAEKLLPNCALPHAKSARKHFFFSTSNIRFWTKNKSREKSSSTADIVNHGDQLRYIKEERNTLRRMIGNDWEIVILEYLSFFLKSRFEEFAFYDFWKG
uniref:Uncharacterized protein n=1 Tax=Elaeophora elaphi TaxID=1147741 RepID=A0A0R3RYJ0_9BILA